MYGYSGHGGYAHYYNAAPLGFDSLSDCDDGYNDWYGYGHTYDNFDPYYNVDVYSHATGQSMYGGSTMSDTSSRIMNFDARLPLTERNLKRHNSIGGGGGYGFGMDDSWDRVMGSDGRIYR
jgi:hypothetical protein